MKRKIKIVHLEEKENDAIAMSKSMSPVERIYLMFELIELSDQLRPRNLPNIVDDEKPTFIVLKKRSHAIS